LLAKLFKKCKYLKVFENIFVFFVDLHKTDRGLMDQEWVYISEFADYLVHTSGQVYNARRERLILPTPVQDGTLTVGLMRNKRQLRITLSRLVALHFLPDPPRDDFNTVIYLDGNKENCSADNLMWRPRWFAVAYHREQHYNPNPNFCGTLTINETGETFDSLVKCARKYGLLQKNIIISFRTGTRVWPTNFTFSVKSR
jgi:hypothetical protein